jgi:DNA-binding NarL/FixJ family response regulator
MTPYRIVLADDHVMVRQGLRRIIEGAADLKVIGEADDGLALVQLLRRLHPDLVILDISMPRLRGIEVIQEAKVIHRDLKVLMLTMHGELELLNAAISAGANGYILKEEADTRLFTAIDRIRRGELYVSPRLSDALTSDWAMMTHDWARACRTAGSPPAEVERLTTREREVLKLTAEGNSSKEIADLLCISTRTVEHHRAHIMTKLKLRKAADVVRYAVQQGYL